MATRSIVTSVPDVACDVCGRRLLRGEHPDVFLASGVRRTVCELCVPRAAAEGWLRESDDHSMGARPARGRRRGSLFGRLRQLREPGERPVRREVAPMVDVSQDGLYDLFDEPLESATAETQEPYEGLSEVEESATGAWDGPPETPLTAGDLKVARALEVFNAGEPPRRIAGVARSLGEPMVSVRPLEDSGSMVAIVVAWELCWYRYEVDLGDEAAGPSLVAQGMELDELTDEDRLANAAADERGELALLVEIS